MQESKLKSLMNTPDINSTNKNNTTNIQDKLKLKYFERLEKNRLYNDSILEDIPQTLTNAVLLDGNIVVKLLKFEGVKSNEGKLLEPKYKPYELSNGQKATEMDKFEFSTRAVVIKKPTQEYSNALDSKLRNYIYDNLEELKTIVWLSPQTLTSMNVPFFDVDRKYPNVDFTGYLTIPITSIQLIEK